MVRRALAEVCTVPVLLVLLCFSFLIHIFRLIVTYLCSYNSFVIGALFYDDDDDDKDA